MRKLFCGLALVTVISCGSYLLRWVDDFAPEDVANR
jgi:hypothetical protein